jgi:hypothetical protein
LRHFGLAITQTQKTEKLKFFEFFRGKQTAMNSIVITIFCNNLEFSLIEGPYRGATRNTLFFGGMSFDNQSGVMTLQGDFFEFFVSVFLFFCYKQ